MFDQVVNNGGFLQTRGFEFIGELSATGTGVLIFTVLAIVYACSSTKCGKKA